MSIPAAQPPVPPSGMGPIGGPGMPPMSGPPGVAGTPPGPKKSRTGMIIGFLAGGLVLVLLVCGGIGFAVWKFFIDDSPQGAEINGEFAVVEEICELFDHKGLVSYLGAEIEDTEEEYYPAYDQNSANSGEAEGATCGLFVPSYSDKTSSVYVSADWYVNADFATQEYEDSKIPNEDGDFTEPEMIEIDGVEEGYFTVEKSSDGKPLWVEVAARAANLELVASVRANEGDVEGAVAVLTPVLAEIIAASRA